MASTNEDAEPYDNRAKEDETDKEEKDSKMMYDAGFLGKWFKLIEWIRRHVVSVLLLFARTSALNPLRTVALVTFLSLGFVVVGLGTNFRVEVDGNRLWVPQNSKQAQHEGWVKNDSNFPPPPAFLNVIILEDNSNNVLGVEGVKIAFDAVDAVTSLDLYKEVCQLGSGCQISSVTSFWESREDFESSTTSDEEAIKAMSQTRFADGKPVSRPEILGTPIPALAGVSNIDDLSDEERTLVSAQSYLIRFNHPPDDEALALEFQAKATLALQEIGAQLEADESTLFQLEVFSDRSFDDEFNRSIENDIPLMVIAFIIMGFFCSFVLSKKNRVESRSALGLGAVITIVFSLCTVYGFFFIVGIPFTSLTQTFPFILVGVGLDDTFIITGYFARTDPRRGTLDRITETIEESGMSMFVSTFTTFTAFILGSMNSIPAVRWFCFYASLSIAVDFIYQITFFIALIVLDERRIKSKRYDFLCCCKASATNGNTNSHAEGTLSNSNQEQPQEPLSSRLMGAYADILLRPSSKVLVLFFFAGVLCAGAYFTSNLTQAFDFTVLTPSDSYVDEYFDALDRTTTGVGDGALGVSIYFRDVNFSNPNVQAAMRSYVDDLVDLRYTTYPPAFDWLRDFDSFVDANSDDLEGLTFEDRMQVFLNTDPYKQLYSKDIVLDDTGKMTASRTAIYFDRIDRYDVQNQIDALLDQRDLTRNQPINKGKRNWSFFTLGELYGLWEFYIVVVGELILSTVLSVVAVFLISLLFIPHPIGSIVVTPTVAMVFIELLGVLNIAGLYINSVTAIGLVMSIGLVVDYSMHIVFTFFEIDEPTRDAKVKGVLKTMGTSVFIGGFSTFLGVLPLAFSKSEVFWTFFVTFLGIVSLGVGHGLIFIPVVLSLIGPVVATKNQPSSEEKSTLVVAKKEVATKELQSAEEMTTQ